MTRRDNIIFYTIVVIVFVGILLCFILFHNNEQNSNAGDPNEVKNSMVEILAPYAAIISAAAALISAVTAVYIGTRKTRRDRIDELKVEIQVVLSQIQEEGYLIVDDKKDEYFQRLEDKFQKEKYKMLHRCAYDELKNEGKVQVYQPPPVGLEY